LENLCLGVAFRIALPDDARCDVCNSIRNFGGWQPVQTLITHALLQEEWRWGVLVLDVGANMGWFTLLARSLGCHVVAFEPQAADHATASLRTALVTSLAINGTEFLQGIDLRTCALDQTQSAGDILNPDPGAAWGLSGIKRSQGGLVQIARMMDVVDEPVWLMKLDTEGVELSVLEGWDESKAPMQHIMIEVKSYNQRLVRDLMAQRGYACRVFGEQYAESTRGVLQLYRAGDLRGLALAEFLSRPCVEGQSYEEHWFSLLRNTAHAEL
jgi:FkbM family methyltransferase